MSSQEQELKEANNEEDNVKVNEEIEKKSDSEGDEELVPNRDSDNDECRDSENLRPSEIPDAERPSENLECPSEILNRPSDNIRPSQFKDAAFRDSRFSDVNKRVSEPKVKFLFKVILIGDVYVGKTCLLTRLIDNEFHNEYKCSVGVEFKVKSLLIDEETVAELRIFDTMGDEKYRSITRQYYRDAEGIFLVYDITSENSFKSLEAWLKDIQDNAPKDCIIFLVGNKSDLTEERKVTHEDGQNFADTKNLFFVEVSAKKGINISLLFEKMSKELVRNAKVKKEEENKNKTLNSSKQALLKEVSSSQNKKGEDEAYSARELLNHTPFSRGWLSARFCNYPQEILLEFPKIVRIKAIQFLSHQYNIASKIEVFVRPPNSENFKKIGYLSLDSNERSNFQARELKTVYPDYQAVQVKFNLLRCHTNSHNIYAQVGLIAVNILGEFPNQIKEPQGIDPENQFDKLEDEMIYDPATLKRLKDLLRAKKKAVELEDFDEAKKIKYAIDNLKSVSQSLIQLEERKKIAIKNDDFDSAKLIKYEIERLRNAVAGLNLAEMNNQIQQEKKWNEGYNNYQQEYQQEEPEPLAEGNKMNLYANKQHALQPINAEYEMDKNEDIYRFQNNINEGYHLEAPNNQNPNFNEIQEEQQPELRQHQNPSNSNQNQSYKQVSFKNQNMNNNMIPNKNVLDVDNLAIKGISKDWSTIVEEQMNDPNMNQGNSEGGAKNLQDLGEIPAAEYKIAEPLIPILTFPIVQMLFSPQWKVKEDGFKQLSEELNMYPNSKILGSHSEEEIMNSCLGVCAHILSSNISQALLGSMDLLKVIFNKFRNYNSQGFARTDFDRYANECIRLLIEHIGDANIKLKERAESTLLECANFNLIGSRMIFEHIISGQIKKSLMNSWKHLQGRYKFLARLIGNFGYNSSEVPLNTIMSYAIKGYNNPQNTVREAALQVITSVYRYEGDKIRPYFKELRPAQVNTIEDALSNIDGLDNEVASGKQVYEYGGGNNENADNMGNNNINSGNMNSGNEAYGDEMVNNSQMLNSGFAGGEGGDSSNTCQFCGLFDINFNEDSLAMHQYKECPMLIQCFKCANIVEISGLNKHYLNECPQKKQFKQCPRCKEAVLIRDFDKHVSDKFCNQAKSPNMANRCPLCHNDITPAGKVGWDTHLVHQGCPNNPRTSGY